MYFSSTKCGANKRVTLSVTFVCVGVLDSLFAFSLIIRSVLFQPPRQWIERRVQKCLFRSNGIQKTYIQSAISYSHILKKAPQIGRQTDKKNYTS